MGLHQSALVFDLGGTHLRCAAARRGELINISRRRIRSFQDGTPSSIIWEEILASIVTYADVSSELVGPNAPVVLSFPGPLNGAGELVNAPTVSGFDTRLPDIRAELSQRTGRPVYVLNDISAAALHLATQCHWQHFMVVTVSSGIGSKICYRAAGLTQVFDRASYAGEIGHLTVDDSDDAPRCDCGQKGHLGAIASGRGIQRLARRRASDDPRCFQQSLCCTRYGASAQDLSNEVHFVPALLERDGWAVSVLKEGTRPLAKVLASAMFAAGLQGIFVIGGFALSVGPLYLDTLCELIAHCCQYSGIEFSGNMLAFGDSGDEVCLRGAARYAQTLGRRES